MEYNVRISDMTPGREVEGFYLLREAAVKTGANGKPFLSATIADKDGSIELKSWDYRGPLGPADAGKIVKVRGEVGEYRGAAQFTAGRIRLATEEDSYDLGALVPVAPIDLDAAFAEVRRLTESIEDADYQNVALALLERYEEDFRRIPAAKSVHHAFLGGLLMHTAAMLHIADYLAWQYAEVIDRSLLLCGTLIHDFAKREEFLFSETGLVTDYSVKGELLGHLVMGAQAAAEAARAMDMPEEKAVLLQHLVLSHHGDPAFGAAVRPMCAEAELLSLIDGIDSRMEIYAETLRDVPAGSFSQRVFALDKKIYRHF